MHKNQIKDVIANILYLNSIDDVPDDSPLFTELGLSSIDYIDLCFELGKKSNSDISVDNLWPINKLMLEKKNFENSTWTQKGWIEVCNILGLDPNSPKLAVKTLYDYFTVNYIEKRMAALV